MHLGRWLVLLSCMALCANGGKERLTTTSSKPVAPNLRGNKLPAVRHPRLEGPISHTPDRGERERERREKASKEAGSIFPDLEYTEADNIGVGLGYQERTPLLVGRNDSAEVRDARSYAAEAARCMCNVDIDGALACYAAAVSLEPKSGWLLDAFGSLLADIGRIDEAEQIFEHSMESDPFGSHIKYMYLGQLRPGIEGLNFFRRGIGVLEFRKQELESKPMNASSATMVEELKNKLCTARCALAEGLLADNDTGAADEEAERELKIAIEMDPQSPEPLQVLASLRLSQERKEEAVGYLQSLYTKLREVDVEMRPSIDFRIASAKLLIEGGLLRECVHVLKTIKEEKDTVGELWYLFCFVYRLMGKEDLVLECARRGKMYLMSVGGSEQARHPVSGELLVQEDFDDIVKGFGISDQHLEAVEKRDRQKQGEADKRGIRTATRQQDASEDEEKDEDDDQSSSGSNSESEI